MKNLLLILLFSSLMINGYCQTATNFTCNDCNGISHDLFAECNAGNVVVLCWVMPCGSCVSGALTCSSICQTYPSKVRFYIADDYANTNCTSLNSWVTSNGITGATTFSNASIDMTAYGTAGMPKAVVIGGANHTVFYNENFTVTPSLLQGAINQALIFAGIDEQQLNISAFNVYPNPSDNSAFVKYTIAHSTNVVAELYDLSAKKVKELFHGDSQAGEHIVEIADIKEIPSGMYLVKISEGGKSQFANIVVTHWD